MKITEQHVSDSRLNRMIEFLSAPVIQRVKMDDDMVNALLELKQRRAEDRHREANGNPT